MTVASLLVFLAVSGPAFAEPPPMSAAELEAAKEAARQSIREGEQHQLKSKYWQTYDDANGCTLVVPSYAEATEKKTAAGSTWTLDLAGDYVVTVTRPATQDANEAVTAALSKYPGATVVAEDTPTGRVFHIQHSRTSADLGVHEEPLVLLELTAPAGKLDETVADRVWQGLSVK